MLSANVGDVVQLPSGGPMMVVQNSDPLECCWFDIDDNCRQQELQQSCLIVKSRWSFDPVSRLQRSDVVSLSSGGPKMTVATIITDGEFDLAECIWFNAKSELMASRFSVRLLKKVESHIV